MILLDEKVAVIFDYDLVIYNFNFAFNKRAHILFLCIKKKRTPLQLFLKERCTDIFTHSYLESPRKEIEAL